MKLKIFISLTIISMIVASVSCKNKLPETPAVEEDKNNPASENIIPVLIPRMNDTVIYTRYDCCFVVTTEIKYPPANADIKGTVLMLHGWNLPSEEWCEKTSFCEKALEKGYVLIIPDYSKSNYCLEIYPETISEYKKYPTITWMMDFQIPEFRSQFGLLKENQNNYVAGISTGGRGATLLAYHMPHTFKGAASLSGDFDITKMTNEFLYYSFLGHYKDFTERWEKECFAYDCKNYKVPTYIGHGKDDNVSPVRQSIMMFDSIKLKHPDLKLIGNFPDFAKHDYDYWESETDNIISFFESLQ